MALTGAVLVVGSFTFLKKSDVNYSAPVINSDIFLLGGGIFIVGVLVGSVLSPGRSDFMKFVNEHNRLNSSGSLKWQMGFNQFPNSNNKVASVGLSWQF